jgi:hypothetical protein
MFDSTLPAGSRIPLLHDRPYVGAPRSDAQAAQLRDHVSLA